MMSLDDGPANGEADTHAAGLGCIEGIKKLVHALTVNADAGIPHHDADAIAVLSFSSDQQLPRPIVDADHRV